MSKLLDLIDKLAGWIDWKILNWKANRSLRRNARYRREYGNDKSSKT